MLVLSRPVNSEILIGEDDTALVPLTAADLATLAALCASDPLLEELGRKLLAQKVGPIVVTVVDVFGADCAEGKKARFGITTPTFIQVDRAEVRAENRRLPEEQFRGRPGFEKHRHRGRHFHIWRDGSLWRNAVQGGVCVQGKAPTRQAAIDLAVASIDHYLDAAPAARGEVA